MARRGNKSSDIAEEACQKAAVELCKHPLFARLLGHTRIYRQSAPGLAPSGWSIARNLGPGRGEIFLHPTRRGTPEEWIWVHALQALRFGLGHFTPHADETAWIATSSVVASRFLADLKLGSPPGGPLPVMAHLPRDEQGLYRHFVENGIPAEIQSLGLNAGHPDMDFDTPPPLRLKTGGQSWPEIFADGLAQAVSRAVLVAGGEIESLAEQKTTRSNAEKARQWFIDRYPLLAGVVAGFKIVTDPLLCQAFDIGIAAIDISDGIIYVNPAAGLDTEESIFVIAHEILHAGLRHDARCLGRDPEIFNIACDFVINLWLVQMRVGRMPPGLLYDPDLDGLSAEEVYDLLVKNLRKTRKLLTLRNRRGGDILSGERGVSIDMDEFCRRALANGLLIHQENGRGYLPAGLVDEIRALNQPPVPWQVELGRWFDDRFTPIERRRNWRRLSRRQEATPDIPRPAALQDQEEVDARTFGVVLDTSMSMNRELLGKALGQIASYAAAKDVRQVRVVFCDAAPYDQGYMSIEEIATRVRIVGRGGTRLQPAITMLEKARDFPEDTPIMIITDGECDRLSLRRDHCFVLPAGARLPFKVSGSVFHIR